MTVCDGESRASCHFLCFLPSAPRIERINDHTCEITWEVLQPMKGDPVIYCLQVMVGKDSEFKQV